MKKIFSLIALAGVIAACTPEQIQTAFKLAGAKGAIDVEVVKLNGDPIEGQFQIAGFDALPGSSIAYSGNKAVITFQAAEGASVALTDLTLTATGENILFPVSGKVTVPALVPGQEAKLACRIRVGETVGEWYFGEEGEAGETELVQSGLLANPHYTTFAYSHAGIESWYVNNSEFMLSGVVEVPYKEGYTAGYDVEFHDYAGFETVYVDYIWGLSVPMAVKDWVEAMSAEDLEEGTAKINFKVSAWAMWNIYDEIYRTPIKARLVAIPLVKDEDGELVPSENEADKKVVASVSYDKFETEAGLIELPYPEAAGHYVKGQGHENGATNAGGGISFNE